MENTTNYGLRKYQSGDLFNPLTVNNPNLDDIDTDMKAISDRAIGRATELVSQGVHAITLLDTDCKTFKFVATGNYSAGETFTVNGIQANAYTPSGSALTSNAFVTGSIVLGALNEDGTAITFYLTGSAVADDSLKLGGELPSYYATQSDMTSAKTDITNLKNQAGNTSIVGIGDGTLSGAVSSLNNDLNDFSFRLYNGKPEFSTDNGTTWTKLGGSSMKSKTVLGTFDNTHRTVDLDSIFGGHFASADDYYVIYDTAMESYNEKPVMANKSGTTIEFRITAQGTFFTTVQIVYNEDKFIAVN